MVRERRNSSFGMIVYPGCDVVAGKQKNNKNEPIMKTDTPKINTSNSISKNRPFFSFGNHENNSNDFFFQKKAITDKKEPNAVYLSKKKVKKLIHLHLYSEGEISQKEDEQQELKSNLKNAWKDFKLERREMGIKWETKECDDLLYKYFPFLVPMKTIPPIGIENIEVDNEDIEMIDKPIITSLQKFRPNYFNDAYPYMDLEPKDFLEFDRIKFSQLNYIWPKVKDKSIRGDLLEKAKKSAKKRLVEFKSGSGIDIVDTIYKKANDNVSLKDTLGSNYIPLTDYYIDIAYDAWAEGITTEPWILLALWFKEGSGKKENDYIQTVSTPEYAKSNWRSQVYYLNFGIDYYIKYTETPGDNTASFYNDIDAINHEATFKARVSEQFRAGRLPRDISNEINSTLNVSGTPGNYAVTPTSKFFALSMMLSSAFYQDKNKQLQANPDLNGKVSEELELAIEESKLLGNSEDLRKYEMLKRQQEQNIDPGLVYLSWNTKNFKTKFLKSADSHRKESDYIKSFGHTPTISEWALETKPKSSEFIQPRENAMRFKYYSDVFKLIFEGYKMDIE